MQATGWKMKKKTNEKISNRFLSASQRLRWADKLVIHRICSNRIIIISISFEATRKHVDIALHFK